VEIACQACWRAFHLISLPAGGSSSALPSRTLMRLSSSNALTMQVPQSWRRSVLSVPGA
jgi:hypothetical protein